MIAPPPATAPDADDAPPRVAGYSSPSIKARRHRILDETRRIIAEGAITQTSMGEIARAAGVAKRTLYNAYRSKERLIAAAIEHMFRNNVAGLTHSVPEGTLDWMVERLVMETQGTLAIRHYTTAMMKIYHADTVDPAIRYAMHDIAAAAHVAWLGAIETLRALQPWTDAATLDRMLVRYRYAVSLTWSKGLIADDRFAFETASGMLTLIVGATRGQARRQAEHALATLADHPLLARPAAARHL